jgi:hypothetical protein
MYANHDFNLIAAGLEERRSRAADRRLARRVRRSGTGRSGPGTLAPWRVGAADGR